MRSDFLKQSGSVLLDRSLMAKNIASDYIAKWRHFFNF